MNALSDSRWPRIAGLVLCLGLAGLGSSVGAADTVPLRGSFTHHYKPVHAFVRAEGEHPIGKLLLASDGQLYGATYQGGSSGHGVIYRMRRSGGGFAVLHSFDDSKLGANPMSGLIEASDGNFYGTTIDGGPDGVGVVFRMTPDGTYTVMHSFLITGTGGWSPWGKLLQASDGKLYGTTVYGGRGFDGTVFRMDLDGTLEIVWHLALGSSTDPKHPRAGLIQAGDGQLYGTSEAGGDFEMGTVFRLGLDGSHEVLHSFDGSDGRQPRADLIQGSDSSLYGTATFGGSHDRGTVFRLTTGGALTVLHHFSETGVDGFWPQTALVEARDGVLLGVTAFGGAYVEGNLFHVRADGRFKTLHDFCGVPTGTGIYDGCAPAGGLVGIGGGEYLGTASSGGARSFGTVYRIRLK